MKEEVLPIAQQPNISGKRPVVSVTCRTYNHENYIKDAIEGFLKQKTKFPVEIIIHDDASTDDTADIIRMYEKKYPHLIKPIYQEENQYSQGKKIGLNYIHPRVKGKYYTICEGDDYWTDQFKLQKQVEFFEKHKKCTLCFHAVEVINENNNKREILRPTPVPQSNQCETEQVIIRGGGYIPTASMMLKSDIVKGIPDWFKQVAAGDYALNIEALSKGDICYIDEVMAVYRKHDGGVWSSKDKYHQFERLCRSTQDLLPHFPQFEKEFYKRLNILMGTSFYNAIVEKDLFLAKNIISKLYHSNHKDKIMFLYYFLGSLKEGLKKKIKK